MPQSADATPPVAFDAELIESLRCVVALRDGRPAAQARLRLVRGCWLVCDATGMKYPIVDGVPVMLAEEGEKWKDTTPDALPVPPPRP